MLSYNIFAFADLLTDKGEREKQRKLKFHLHKKTPNKPVPRGIRSNMRFYDTHLVSFGSTMTTCSLTSKTS